MRLALGLLFISLWAATPSRAEGEPPTPGSRAQGVLDALKREKADLMGNARALLEDHARAQRALRDANEAAERARQTYSQERERVVQAAREYDDTLSDVHRFMTRFRETRGSEPEKREARRQLMAELRGNPTLRRKVETYRRLHGDLGTRSNPGPMVVEAQRLQAASETAREAQRDAQDEVGLIGDEIRDYQDSRESGYQRSETEEQLGSDAQAKVFSQDIEAARHFIEKQRATQWEAELLFMDASRLTRRLDNDQFLVEGLFSEIDDQLSDTVLGKYLDDRVSRLFAGQGFCDLDAACSQEPRNPQSERQKIEELLRGGSARTPDAEETAPGETAQRRAGR